MLLSASNSMATREKFGKLVLLEESDATGLGPEYRAAKLGSAGLEKIVTILRLSPAISGNPEIARSLMDQAKVAAQLQSPHVLKIFGIGKVEQTYYISYEHTEGKSLRAILERCREEVFPLQIEHSLLIASKVCSALEYAHGRKSDTGRYLHGLLTPAAILVSYDGEIRVKGFGYWTSRVKEVLAPEELRYLAPEQRNGPGEPRSDLFALGAILFEALTGHLPSPGAEVEEVASARLASPQGDDDLVPAPVAEILRRSLASDPAARYPDVQDMRKALDTLLFSGDFSPTTFNLAFFMHSLYREDIEREAKRLKEDREASYLEFLTDEVARTPPPVRPASVSPPLARTEPLDARAIAARIPPAPLPVAPPEAPPAGPAAAFAARPSLEGAGHGVTSKEAAAGFTFHKEEKKAKGIPLAVPLVLVLLLGGAAAYYFFMVRPQATPVPPPTAAPATLSAEALAAQGRIKELEDKLKALEEEKALAATRAADEARKKIEAQAAAQGQTVDPAAVEKAKEEARRKANADQDKRQQDELRRLEEQKKAEETRVAEEKRRADEQAKAEAAAASATPSPTEAPPSVIPVKPGALVALTDAGVVPPVVDRQSQLVYPPIALRQRMDGTVELNVLVDEKGNVADVTVVTPAGGRTGLNEAAVENVKRRHYRPATRDGVPVRVWVPVRVRFELPR